MKKALLLIDIQNDYFPGGKMELVHSLKASEKAKSILDYFREKQELIVHIQHISTKEGSTFFLPNTPGVEIHQNVTPKDNEKVVIKHFPNSFIQTELLEYLKNQEVKHLVVVGMMTHMCVDATVRAARDLGFTIELIGDACATKNLEVNAEFVGAKDVQTAFLAGLNYFYSTVITSEQYLKG